MFLQKSILTSIFVLLNEFNQLKSGQHMKKQPLLALLCLTFNIALSQNWQAISHPKQGVSDFIYHKGRLLTTSRGITVANTYEPYLASSDGGQTWQRVKYLIEGKDALLWGATDKALIASINFDTITTNPRTETHKKVFFQSRDTGTTWTRFDSSTYTCHSYADVYCSSATGEDVFMQPMKTGIVRNAMKPWTTAQVWAQKTSIWRDSSDKFVKTDTFKVYDRVNLAFPACVEANNRFFLYSVDSLYALDSAQGLRFLFKTNAPLSQRSLVAKGDTILVDNGQTRSYDNGQTWLRNQSYINNVRVQNDVFIRSDYSYTDISISYNLQDWKAIPFSPRSMAKKGREIWLTSESVMLYSDNDGDNWAYPIKNTDNIDAQIFAINTQIAEKNGVLTTVPDVTTLSWYNTRVSFFSKNNGTSWQPFLDSKFGFFHVLDFEKTDSGYVLICLTHTPSHSLEYTVFSADSSFKLREKLSNVCFTSRNIKYKLSKKDNILWLKDCGFRRSEDGGRTWIPINFEDIKEVFFAQNKFWGLDNYHLLSSTDGVQFQYADTALAYRPYPKKILKTTEKLYYFRDNELLMTQNAGISWKTIKTDNLLNHLARPIQMRDFAVKDSLILVALHAYQTGLSYDSYTQGRIYASKNDGTTWQDITPPYLDSAYYDNKSRSFSLLTIGDSLFAESSIREFFKTPFSKVQCNVTSGVVFDDKNRNNVRDADEKGVPNVLIQAVPSAIYAQTDSVGRYAIGAKLGDTIRIIPLNKYVSATPEFSVLTRDNDTIKNFAVYTQLNINDLRVNLTTPTVFRTGFETTLILTMTNEGTTTQRPTIRFVKDSKLDFRQATPTPNVQQSNVFEWTALDSLQPLESRQIQLVLRTPIAVNFGAMLENIATIEPQIRDETTDDNVFSLKNTVVGSYDPNDKSVEPRTIDPQYSG
jgi:hypothetical protein